MPAEIPGLICNRCGGALLRLTHGASCTECDGLIPDRDGVLCPSRPAEEALCVPLESPSLHELLESHMAGLDPGDQRRVLHQATGRTMGALALLAPLTTAPYALVYPADYGAVAVRIAQLRSMPVLAFDRDFERLRFLARRLRLMGILDVYPVHVDTVMPALAPRSCRLAVVLPGVQAGDRRWLDPALAADAEGLLVRRGTLWSVRRLKRLRGDLEGFRVARTIARSATRRFRLGPHPTFVSWVAHGGGEAPSVDRSEHLAWVTVLPGGAPLVAVVAGAPSLLECALREVMAAETPTALEPAVVSATGMLIQLLGTGDRGRVLRMPFTIDARVRAERNHAMLRALEQSHRLPETVIRRLPRAGRQGEVRGAPFFIEQRVSGVPGTELLRDDASGVLRSGAAFIRGLHGATARRMPLNREYFGKRISSPLAALRRAFPWWSSAFQELEDRLATLMIGEEILWVFAHGDFKPDNCFFDPETRSLEGVIDWDQSEEPGLPLLDLIHFFQAARRLGRGLSYGQVVELGVPDDELAREILEDYLQLLEIDPGWLQWMFLLDAIDHLSQHVPGPNELDSSWIDANVSPIAAAIQSRLGAASEAAPQSSGDSQGG